MDREKVIDYILLQRPKLNRKDLESLSDNALMMLQVQIEISLLQST
jgi:hypothetical protein